ncbi:MAG TPA: ADOP family duplicated permease [Vicinamibacterales bacterium]|nr:ADOP family duplicated permease [Vicinamibacterales bacterium]
MRHLLRRLRRLLRWKAFDTDLAEEMALHRELAQRDLETAGVAPPAAAAAAQRAFGNSALAAERARDVWRPVWLLDLGADLRFAGRLALKERAFTCAIVAVLGLGIGVANLQFVLIDAICIRGLPIRRVDRVLFLGARDRRARDVPLSSTELDHIRDAAQGLATVAAFATAPAVLGDDEHAPDRVTAAYASAALFRVLDEAPLLGRDFTAEDDHQGAAPVAIVTSAVWRTRYSGEPAIVGRTIRINGTPATIVGVMRDRFRFPSVTDVWLPFAAMRGGAADSGPARAISGVARMSDGVDLPAIRAVVTTTASQLARAYPATNAGITLTAVRINERFNGRLTDAVWIAFASVAVIVLLIACANAANLLLMRAARRGHEMAMRASLGASHARIVRQLLVESAAIAALGGVAGATLSALGLQIINRIIPENTLAYWMRFALDARAVALLCGLCAATVLLFGLAPAVHAARTDVNDVLKSGGRGGFGGARRGRWTTVFLTVECALTMVMLAALVMGWWNARESSRRFVDVDTSNVLTTWITLPADRYRSADARRTFYGDVEERIGSLPGTSVVAAATALPLGGAQPRSAAIDDQPADAGATLPTVYGVTVSARYFDALGVALVRGRPFGARDGLAGSAAAIVNQKFVEMFLSDRDPIGRRIRLMEPNVQPAAVPALTIVGIAPTIRQRTNWADPDPIVYLPLAAAPPSSAALFIRSAQDSMPNVQTLRNAFRAMDPELPLYRTVPLADALGAAQWNGRISTLLLNGITIVAVWLAAIGLYAVIAHGVVQQTREIGIRAALGATQLRLLALVARRATLHFGLGVIAGIGCVFGFSRLIASGGGGGGAGSGHDMTDPSTLAAVIGLLAIITALASIAPAWRATRIDPARVLRDE